MRSTRDARDGVADASNARRATTTTTTRDGGDDDDDDDGRRRATTNDATTRRARDGTRDGAGWTTLLSGCFGGGASAREDGGAGEQRRRTTTATRARRRRDGDANARADGGANGNHRRRASESATTVRSSDDSGSGSGREPDFGIDAKTYRFNRINGVATNRALLLWLKRREMWTNPGRRRRAGGRRRSRSRDEASDSEKRVVRLVSRRRQSSRRSRVQGADSASRDGRILEPVLGRGRRSVSARSRARVASRRALFVRPLVRSLALLRIVHRLYRLRSPSPSTVPRREETRRRIPRSALARGRRARHGHRSTRSGGVPERPGRGNRGQFAGVEREIARSASFVLRSSVVDERVRWRRARDEREPSVARDVAVRQRRRRR